MICLTHMVPLKSAQSSLKHLAGNNLPNHMSDNFYFKNSTCINYLIHIRWHANDLHTNEMKEIQVFSVGL